MCACNNEPIGDNLSTRQDKLRSLIKEFSQDYERAVNTAAKKEVETVYENHLRSYLFDSCGGVLDSMLVKVEKVEVTKDALLMNFTDGNIRFYTKQYFRHPDSLKKTDYYKYAIGLREKSDTLLRFAIERNVDVNGPIKTFSIEVVSGPQTLSIH